MWLIVGLVFVLLLLGFLKIRRILTPPKELEELPNYFPNWKIIKEMLIDGMSMPERRKRYPETRNRPITKMYFFGHWEVCISDPEICREIYTNVELYPKTLFFEQFPEMLNSKFFGVSLAFSNGETWRRHHKVISPAFQTKNLVKITHHSFQPCVALALSEIQKVDSSPVDIHEWAQRLTLDALGKAAYSFDFGSLKNPKAEYVIVYKDIIKGVLNPILMMFPPLANLPIPYVTRMKQQIKKFDSMMFSVIDARKKLREESKAKTPEICDEDSAVDLLDLMVCSTDLSNQELRNDLVLFFIAGHDTSATSIAVTAYFFAKYPEIQEKVRKEVMDVFEKSKAPCSFTDWVPSYEDQRQFEYLTACIKESLRLYPPAGVVPPRYCTQDVKIGEYDIPKGTNISIIIFDMHRSNDVWGPDAEEYIPERFLPEEHAYAALDRPNLTTQPTRNNHPMAFNAFGASQRSCIGQTFSMIEQRIFLSALLAKYEVSLPAGMEEIRMGPSTLLSPIDLLLNFKRRC